MRQKPTRVQVRPINGARVRLPQHPDPIPAAGARVEMDRHVKKMIRDGALEIVETMTRRTAEKLSE